MALIWLASVEGGDLRVLASARGLLLPVQLYFQGDDVVDVLQHVGHGGVWGVGDTRQRNRVPPAHLDQTCRRGVQAQQQQRLV